MMMQSGSVHESHPPAAAAAAVSRTAWSVEGKGNGRRRSQDGAESHRRSHDGDGGLGGENPSSNSGAGENGGQYTGKDDDATMMMMTMSVPVVVHQNQHMAPGVPDIGLGSIIQTEEEGEANVVSTTSTSSSSTTTTSSSSSSSSSTTTMTASEVAASEEPIGSSPKKASSKPILPATICPIQQQMNYPYNRIQSTCSSLGRYLARRLVQIGASDVFSVPGDFNLVLLDHLLSEPSLRLIGCCNELNAGYAADGYARAHGVGACVVTFTVGGLSILNAIAGAYSENLPVICIVGGPNSNDYGTNRILHHTIGLPDFSQELRCFQQVTCSQVTIQDLDTAHELIDGAISTALIESKPVYINISCNLAGLPYPSFGMEPVPYVLRQPYSNAQSLEAAVNLAADFLNGAVKPVLVGGSKMRVARAESSFVELANSSGYAVAVMPSAKGLFPETHPHFMGTYWGAISSPVCVEIVESADAYLFAGPVFNDYSSVGYSLLFKKEKAVIVQPDRVIIGNGVSFGCILMRDFLSCIAKKIVKNTAAYDNYRRMYIPPGLPLKSSPEEPLRVNVLFQHIQEILDKDTALIAETGDSWFNCQKLHLPEGCRYEFQMQYGSIGWSVGAVLGYAQAAPKKRVIACIGDGSFQVTAQEVSTMIRQGQNNVIFLINNGGYTIEVEIHDGPYNIIQNWNYTAVVEAFANNEGKVWTTKVRTEEELEKAISMVRGPKKDCLCFLECILHKDDTSKELLEWGSRVSAANSRPPNPQ